MPTVKVPLPPDYFKCPPLSPRDIQRYIALGEQSVKSLLRKVNGTTGGPYDWKLLKDESELKIYKGSHSHERHSGRRCGVVQVVGQIDESIELYRDDTTDQAREYARRVGRTTYVDVVNLYTVLPRHPDRPNDCIQIKWVLAKSPLDGLVTRRDFVVVESELEFQVGDKRAWVRSFHSIELDDAAVADDDTKTIDLSDYGESVRERPIDQILIDIPSMRQLARDARFKC
ncbi:hypothetical protein AC1031_014638 [Aphanomyces cochlioides]|nr:hypothetical protein AC1031_014638 [Aphanomyces cochlioides]